MRRALAAGAIGAALAAGMTTGHGQAPPERVSGRVCMDAAAWSANDGRRPCWALRVFEDGSARATLRRADGRRVWRACSLPATDGGAPTCGPRKEGR